MINQYVNLSPQQQMARALQQQGDQTQLQGAQAQTPAAQNPFGGAVDAVKMYGQMSQRNNMSDMNDYLARLKLGQSATGGMFDSANVQGGNYTANNGT